MTTNQRISQYFKAQTKYISKSDKHPKQNNNHNWRNNRWI